MARKKQSVVVLDKTKRVGSPKGMIGGTGTIPRIPADILIRYLQTDWRKLRQDAGLSVADMARKLGVSRVTVYAIENHCVPAIPTLCSLLRYWDMNDDAETLIAHAEEHGFPLVETRGRKKWSR